MRKSIILILAVILSANIAGATSLISLPNTYAAGSKAKAAEANANEQHIQTQVNTHNAATTGEHGVTGTIVGTSDTQTFSNKTTGDLTWSSGAKAIFGSSGRYWIDDTTNYAIESSTHVAIPATAKLMFDGGGDTYATESSANVLDLYTGGTKALSLSASQIATFGSSIKIPSGSALYLDGGNNTYIYEVSGDSVSFIVGGVQRLAIDPVNGVRGALAAGTGSDMVYDTTTQQLMYVTSSEKYKKNIKPIESLLDKVLAIPVKRYDRKNSDAKNEIGIIAEELYPLFPELVPMKNGEPESVSYSRLSVILLKALQEQNEVIKNQQSQINSLIKRIEKLEQKVGN